MIPIDKNTQILSSFKIDISFQDLEKKIKTSGNSPGIFKTAEKTLAKMQGKWEPVVLFQWFDFEIDNKTKLGRILQTSGNPVSLDLGHSIRFLKHAQNVIVSSYTIGKSLDDESTNASSNGNMLEAYIIDLIGLTALEKTGNLLIKHTENQAKTLGWGVSPFLSPGSVHGWDLKEQSKLSTLLPIQQINMTLKKNAILIPVKSMIALIGIGPEYNSTKVGSTCDVCNKKNSCEMKGTH